MSRESKRRLTLVIGNKNYSSWSFRPGLALRQLGLPFEEIRVPLDPAAARYAATIRALPAVEEWYAAARAESEVLPQFEKRPAGR